MSATKPSDNTHLPEIEVIETNKTQKESELKVINEVNQCDFSNKSSETNLECSDLTGNIF